jgi:hypothetical protein
MLGVLPDDRGIDSSKVVKINVELETLRVLELDLYIPNLKLKLHLVSKGMLTGNALLIVRD